jgi:hypothetical protein
MRDEAAKRGRTEPRTIRRIVFFLLITSAVVRARIAAMRHGRRHLRLTTAFEPTASSDLKPKVWIVHSDLERLCSF